MISEEVEGNRRPIGSCPRDIVDDGV